MTPLLHGFASPMLDSVMWAITTLGSTLVVAPLFILAETVLLLARRRREALFLAIAILGSVVMNALLKFIFQRPRPALSWAQTPLDFSFPSGHTMNSLAFYLALALIAWVIWGPKVGIPATFGAVVVATLIGVSRIYLGAHYFSDVVAGFAAGLAWLLIVSAGFDAGSWLAHWRFARPEANPPPVPPA
jgi:undecaprenyl-diphosphatase